MGDVIGIRDLRVECVVGVYPNERDSVQPLIIDLELEVDTRMAAKSERLAKTLNYHMVASQVVFLLQSCRFRLLETAARVLATTLLAPPAVGEGRVPVERLRLTLSKPGALRGAATPSLTVAREAGFVAMGHEERPFGTVDIIHVTKDAGIYRLNIAPGRGIPLHRHERMHESEMILGDQLQVNGRKHKPGTVFRWPFGAKHRYDNPSNRWQTVLCVDSPPFVPNDEIPEEGEPDRVDPEPAWVHRGG